MSLLQLAALVGGIGVLGSPAAAQRAVLEQDFPYMASGEDVQQVVNEIRRRTGLNAVLSDGVTGTVSLRGNEGTVSDVLSEITSQTQAIWWYDGSVLHLESSNNMTTVIVNAQGTTLAEVEAELDSLGLYDPRFQIRSTANGAIFRISGPEGYVTQVVSLIETLIEISFYRTRVDEDLGIYVPRVYHGRRLN